MGDGVSHCDITRIAIVKKANNASMLTKMFMDRSTSYLGSSFSYANPLIRNSLQGVDFATEYSTHYSKTLIAAQPCLFITNDVHPIPPKIMSPKIGLAFENCTV